MCAQTHQLVLTGAGIERLDRETLSALLPIDETMACTSSSVRVPVARHFVLPEPAKNYLLSLKIDANIVPDKPFDFFKLIVSDMDSTLITIECIDELAAWTGQKDRVAAITEQAMAGMLDFQSALTQRVELLRGMPEQELASVYQQKLKLTEGAQTLVEAAKHAGIHFVLVSGGFTFFAQKLKDALGLDEVYANTLEIVDGLLTGRVIGPVVDGQAKLRILKATRARLGVEPEQVIALGDGANDLPMLCEAGVGVAFYAKETVRRQVACQINYGALDTVATWFC